MILSEPSNASFGAGSEVRTFGLRLTSLLETHLLQVFLFNVTLFYVTSFCAEPNTLISDGQDNLSCVRCCLIIFSLNSIHMFFSFVCFFVFCIVGFPHSCLLSITINQGCFVYGVSVMNSIGTNKELCVILCNNNFSRLKQMVHSRLPERSGRCTAMPIDDQNTKGIEGRPRTHAHQIFVLSLSHILLLW